MRYRVHVRCEEGDLIVNLAYVVRAADVKKAKDLAVTMAMQHYPEFEIFQAYHVEALEE